MGVFSRKKVTEDVPVEEKRQEEAKTASSVKSVLEGSLLAELIHKYLQTKTAAEYPVCAFCYFFRDLVYIQWIFY